MSEVADAVARVDWPVTPRVPATPRLYPGVVEPIPSLPLAAKLNKIAPVDEAMVRGLTPLVPRTAREAIGVDDPIPTLPLASTERKEAFDEEATLKMVLVDPDTPRTLKATVEEVALTPRTVPLSIRVEVPRVVAESQRVAKPKEPPVRLLPIPSDEVDTHCVLVPVERRTCPTVPEAFVESRRAPRIVKLEVVAVVTRRLEVDAFVKVALVAKSLDVVALVDDELVATKIPVAVALVSVVLPRVERPVTLSVPPKEPLPVAKSPVVKRLSAVRPADDEAEARYV